MAILHHHNRTERFSRFLRTCTFEFLLSLICLSCYAQTTSIDQLISYPENTVLVAAHRGDWQDFPENSISGIKSCIEKGIDIIEIDVQKTKDNKFVLMHDGSINRTTNGTGRVGQFVRDDLKKYRLKEPDGKYGNEKIPSLEEVLLLAKGKIVLNLDRSANHFDELLLIIDSIGARQNVILKGISRDTGFNQKIAENPDGPLFMPILLYMPQSKLTTFLINSEAVIVELILANDTSYLSSQKGLHLFKKEKCRIWYNALSKKLALGFSEKLDAIETWNHLIAKGAFIIQTDYPFQLMQYLINKGLHTRPNGWQDLVLTNLPKKEEVKLVKTPVGVVDRKIGKQPNVDKGYHIIKEGDTLSHIAIKQKMSVAGICALNLNLTPTTILKIGRRIRVR